MASTHEGELVFDPFCGSGTTAVAAKELDCFFVGVELEEVYCELAGRRIRATKRGSLVRGISDLRAGDGGDMAASQPSGTEDASW